MALDRQLIGLFDRSATAADSTVDNSRRQRLPRSTATAK
jgi:hypothetical protein